MLNSYESEDANGDINLVWFYILISSAYFMVIDKYWLGYHAK